MPRGARGGAYPGERRGGRQKGTPNKATVEFKEAVNRLLNEATPYFTEWLKAVPAEKRLELLGKLAEYCHPKLGRTEVEHSGSLGVTLEQLVPKRKPPTEGER